MRLKLLAFATLFVTGCARNAASVVDGDPFNSPPAAQTVYVWNGKECVEALRTPEELRKRKMYRLSSSVVKNGEMQKTEVWVEGIKPEVLHKRFAQGGSIPLPNGEKLEVPALEQRRIVAVENGRIPMMGGGSVAVEGVPDGTQVDLHTFVDKDGDLLEHIEVPELTAPSSNQQTVTTVNVAELQATPPDKAEWWKSAAAVDAASKQAVKVPPASSTLGRVGTASVSYGMGQISRP
ncbi:MAG TPA: hypothetical protein VM510_05680 [Caulifigura sp.]|nr:hypothetical protein [Caulifigura sp.]